MIFTKKISNKKNHFHNIHFFHLITAPRTLNGSQNIQGFTLIRAVLFISKVLPGYLAIFHMKMNKRRCKVKRALKRVNLLENVPVALYYNTSFVLFINEYFEKLTRYFLLDGRV